MSNVQQIVRRHLVRYDSGQETTLCGLSITRNGKWPYLSAPGGARSIRCVECDSLHEAEIEEFAAEFVFEMVTA